MSPTQRTLRALRDDGWTVDVVERQTGPVKRDLFGMFDLLAVRGQETLAVQVTSGSNVSARVRKVTDHNLLPAVRDAGWRVEVWGWRKLKREGWQPRIVDLS